MRGRRHKLQVSTFPFLAVLLCAMGSLILVLLVMDRKAHRAAQARAQREAVRLAEERAQGAAAQQAQRERLQQQARKEWEQKRDALHARFTREQIEMQVQMRKVREQLQEIAARLHYEQDTSTELRRKVQGERDRLQAEEQLLRTLRSRADQSAHQSKESSQALRRMTLDLLQMEQALKDLQASRKREQKTFSVVPYHGRRGENRRPIYVECTADSVIFHPERKVISLTALLPGVPEPSVAVRAEVEQRVVRQRAKLATLPANTDMTPYLLLLVRPSGVNTYNYLYHCALKDLQIKDKEVQVDFGYEFIDDDWVLDFPADDEQPSAQPWMIATKTSTPAPSPARNPVPSSPPRTTDHPIALAPMGDLTGNAGGIRGFRASETGGMGNWVTGSQEKPGSTRTGPSMPVGAGRAAASALPGAGGSNGSPSFAPGLPGSGGGGGPLSGGGQGLARNGTPGLYPPGSGGTGSPTLAPFSQGGGGGSDALASSSSTGQMGGGQGGRGMGVGTQHGTGRGHPAALVPAFREGGGGGDYSGDGPPPPNGFSGSGVFSLRGSNTGQGYGSSVGGSPGGAGPGVTDATGSGSGNGVGSPSGLGEGSRGSAPLAGGTSGGASALAGPGSPGGGGSDLPGLGPPRALSSSPRDGYTGGSTGQSNSSGTGSAASGTQGNGTASGSSSGTVASGPVAGTGTSPNGQYASAQGSNGRVGFRPGSSVRNGNTAPGNPGTVGTPGSGGPPAGTPTPPGTTTPGNGRRSSDTVIYVDPLTGKATAPPRPPTSPDGSAEDNTPDTGDPQHASRVRVVTAGSGGGTGGDAQGEAMSRFAPTPSMGGSRHKPVAAHPVWVHGGRDWTIYVECRADSLVLYPSQRAFPLAQIMSDSTGNPLAKAIQQMIERRQALRRPGEPPYRPQVCLLVRPEYTRTFLTIYPALEALPVPKTRRNLDADDDVIDIVNGTSP